MARRLGNLSPRPFFHYQILTAFWYFPTKNCQLVQIDAFPHGNIHSERSVNLKEVHTVSTLLLLTCTLPVLDSGMFRLSLPPCASGSGHPFVLKTSSVS